MPDRRLDKGWTKADLGTRILLARRELAHAKAMSELTRSEAAQKRSAMHLLETDRNRLRRQTNEDALNGLPKRRAADAALAALEQDAGQAALQCIFCVALLDIDH